MCDINHLLCHYGVVDMCEGSFESKFAFLLTVRLPFFFESYQESHIFVITKWITHGVVI